jgi:hypothetical protein
MKEIKMKEKFDTLEKAVQPLIEFLKENYNSMAIAVVSEDRVDIFTKSMGTPLEIKN